MSISPVKLFGGIKAGLKNGAKKVKPKKIASPQVKEAAEEVVKKAGTGVSKVLSSTAGFIPGVTGFGLPAAMIVQSYSNQPSLQPPQTKCKSTTA